MNLQPGFVPMFRPVAVPLVRVAVPIHPGMGHPPPPPPGQAHFFPGAPIGPPPAPPPNQPNQSATTHGLPPGLIAIGATTQPGVQGGSVSLANSQSVQHASATPLMSIGILGQAPQMTQAAVQSSLQSQGLLPGLPQPPPSGASPSPGITVGQVPTGQFPSRGSYTDDSQRNALASRVPGQLGEVEMAMKEPPQDGGMAVLDDFNSDLNLGIDQDGYGAKALTKPPGFCFCWAGARSTYGVCKGKAYYEVHISEHLAVDFGTDHQETDPHVVRVGWSVDSSSMQLGEEPWSYGYGGTGKFSANSKFSNYGEKFMAGDVIGALLDLESRPPTISYCKNGQWLGVAVPIHSYPVGQTDMALFPHVLSKNCGFKVNFGQMAPWYPPPQGYAYIDQLPLSCKVRGMEAPAHKSDCEMIMIVGLPGAGKTTWGINMQKGYPDKRYNIIGTDTLIDKMRVMGLPRRRNYHGRWDVLIDKATKCLNTLFQIASKRNRNYILDQTNVYPSAQKRKMGYFQGFYRKAAILVPEDKELIRRSIKRTEEDGKHVPEEAVLEMKKNFQLPDPNSSFFDEINFVELPREVAVGLVLQYNQEAREKLSNRSRTFDRFSGNQHFQSSDTQAGQQYGRSSVPGGQGQHYQNWQSQQADSRSYGQPQSSSGYHGNDWHQASENPGRKRGSDDHRMDNRKRSRSDQSGGSALDFIKQEYAEEEADTSGMAAAAWQGVNVKEEPKYWDQYGAGRQGGYSDQSFGQSRFQQNAAPSDHRRNNQLPENKHALQDGADSYGKSRSGYDSGFSSFGQQDGFQPQDPSHTDSWRKEKGLGFRDSNATYGQSTRTDDSSKFSGNSFADLQTDRKSFQSGNWNDNFSNSAGIGDSKPPPVPPLFSDHPQEDYSQPRNIDSQSRRNFSDFGNSQNSSQGFSSRSSTLPPNSGSQGNRAPASNRRHFSADDSRSGQPTTGRTRQRKSKWDTPSDSPEPNIEPQLPDFQSRDSGNVSQRDSFSQPLSSIDDFRAPPDKEPSWDSSQNSSWPPKPQPLLQMTLPNMHNKFSRFSDNQGLDSGNSDSNNSRNQPGQQRSNWNSGQNSGDSDFSTSEELNDMNSRDMNSGTHRMRGSGRGFGPPRGGPRFPNRPPLNQQRFGPPPRAGGPRNFGPRNPPPPHGGARGGWNPPPRGPRGFEGRGGGPRNFPPRFGGPRMGGPRFPRMGGQQRWPRP